MRDSSTSNPSSLLKGLLFRPFYPGPGGVVSRRVRLRRAWAHLRRHLEGRVLTPRKQLRRSGLFDEHFYVETYPDVARSGLDALSHFVRYGAFEGRMPHPLFDTAYYLRTHPDVAEAGINPLTHYLRRGGLERRDPHPLFDAKYYVAQAPEGILVGLNPLVHFLREGAARAWDPCALFDTSYYLATNPAVARSAVNPLVHFVRFGAFEGRSPSPWFDTSYYLETNPDVAASGINPLQHFLEYGASERRDPSPWFDTSYYLETNPDVAATGMNALLHFITCGEEEGRDPSPGARHLMIRGFRDRRGQRPEAVRSESPPWLIHDLRTSLLDYEKVRRRLDAMERSRIGSLSLAPCNLISLTDADLGAAAAALALPWIESPEVSIIIPVHNHVRLTLECLQSVLRATSGLSFEVVVFDNGSSDDTERFLSAVAGLVYRRSATNLGFGPACNEAAHSARGRYLLFLNNDVQVRNGWLGALRRTFDEHDSVGAAGPMVLFPDGRLQEAGAAVNTDGTTTLIGLFHDPSEPRWGYSREVDYCSGVCLMVEAARFHQLGGFDPGFAPAYYEDVDLCLRLRDLGLRILYNPDSVIVHHHSVTAKALDPGTGRERLVHHEQRLVERHQERIDRLNRVRLIALHLPWFHPIADDDRWWGVGSTEWRSVARARPNFEGHDQPRLPADLGFYDPRLPETARQQVALAQRYGVEGFCYYRWSAAQCLGERPLDVLLSQAGPVFPFCLAWNGDEWARLSDERSSHDVDLAVIRDVARYLRRSEYIRIGGKPLLLVTGIDLAPRIRHTIGLWREACLKDGIGEVYLAVVEPFGPPRDGASPRAYGFDASVELPPHGVVAPEQARGRLINPRFRGRVCDYQGTAVAFAGQTLPGHTRFGSVMPAWDDTPQEQAEAVVFTGSSPGAYQAWLEHVVRQTREQNFGDERIVFINAWNNWAEGAFLEPDLTHGHAYLEATRNALDLLRLERP